MNAAFSSMFEQHSLMRCMMGSRSASHVVAMSRHLHMASAVEVVSKKNGNKADALSKQVHIE